jgi:DUF971 family protein
MLQVEKIISPCKRKIVIKWSDGKTQAVSAVKLQENCECARCLQKDKMIDPNVLILSFSIKGRLGVKISFSSGCQSGIHSFNKIRSWLKEL